MRTNDKCCGNCLHFHNEDVRGYGWCYVKNMTKNCVQRCVQHEFKDKENK